MNSNDHENPIKVYIRIDDGGNVVEVASSIFLQNPEGWIEVDSGYGDKYAHAQSNYLEKPLFDEDSGIPLYKWDGENIVARSNELATTMSLITEE